MSYQVQAKAFPDYAVKQAFAELSISRNDNLLLTTMQDHVLPCIMTMLLKSSVVSCVMHNRKMISMQDVMYAKNVCVFPISNRLSSDLGYILNKTHLSSMCAEHIKYICKTMCKMTGCDTPLEVKMSKDGLQCIQNIIERCIRGFIETMQRMSSNGTCSYTMVDACLMKIMHQNLNDTLEFNNVGQ